MKERPIHLGFSCQSNLNALTFLAEGIDSTTRFEGIYVLIIAEINNNID